MLNMDVWDIALLAAGAYIAVMSLVRLMRSHRDTLVSEIEAQAEQERRRRQREERRRTRANPARAALQQSNDAPDRRAA